MRRFALIAALALVAAGGCAHTKTTDEGRQEKNEKNDKNDKREEKNEKPTGAETEKPHAGSGARESTHREGGGAEHSVPLATAPGGLLAPGAEQKIREKLAAAGCLEDEAKPSGAR